MTAGPDSIARWWLAATGVVALALACGEDPTASEPVCGDQPPITVGASVEGALTEGDQRFADSYIDYYALQVDVTDRLTVTLSSTEMDPLILLFDRGRVLEQAFHAAGSLPGVEEAPTITRSFSPGCHLLGASAFTPDTTGAYTLSVERAVP